ncbi:hypothetical protein D1872_257180 [compost metagenome]
MAALIQEVDNGVVFSRIEKNHSVYTASIQQPGYTLDLFLFVRSGTDQDIITETARLGHDPPDQFHKKEVGEQFFSRLRKHDAYAVSRFGYEAFRHNVRMVSKLIHDAFYFSRSFSTDSRMIGQHAGHCGGRYSGLFGNVFYSYSHKEPPCGTVCLTL